jgi:divalent metal cation (Fe/Co/Zn/Cd) transporter
MTPEFDKVLTHLATTLLAEIAPLIPVDYAQKNTQLAAMLLSAGVEEWDRAVERRVDENRSMRALFLDALPVVADAALRRRLESAGVEAESPLRVSALNAENDRLRSLLIDLHAHVEDLDSPASRRIEDAIWDELRRSTERRRLSIAPF